MKKIELYFSINVLKDGGEHEEFKIEPKALIPKIIEIKSKKLSIVFIKDNFGDLHTEKEMINIFKESIDTEYEDVQTIEEGYNLAHDYFLDLCDNKIITENKYKEYMSKLEEYKQINSINKFINKVTNLYVT